MSAFAVTGHSTTNLPNGRFAFETGYSAMGAGGRAVNDRLRPWRTGTPDPEETSAVLFPLPESGRSDRDRVDGTKPGEQSCP
jgi:hypothetical protein